MTDAELARRLERLERDNRRFKRFGFIALVLAAGLGLMAATRPVPQKITAREFDAVDKAGRVRVAMGVSPPQTKGPALVLYDTSSNAVAELLTMSAGNQTLSNLSIWDPQNKTMAQIGNALGVPLLQLTGPPQTETAISMGIGQGAPNINIRDVQGFEMDLGGTKTVTTRTGQTQKTSATSIVMFGNDKEHHVIWQAP